MSSQVTRGDRAQKGPQVSKTDKHVMRPLFDMWQCTNSLQRNQTNADSARLSRQNPDKPFLKSSPLSAFGSFDTSLHPALVYAEIVCVTLSHSVSRGRSAHQTLLQIKGSARAELTP